jgi:hypothetical protein
MFMDLHAKRAAEVPTDMILLFSGGQHADGRSVADEDGSCSLPVHATVLALASPVLAKAITLLSNSNRTLQVGAGLAAVRAHAWRAMRRQVGSRSTSLCCPDLPTPCPCHPCSWTVTTLQPGAPCTTCC